MAPQDPIEFDLERIDQLIAQEEATLEPKHRASIEYRAIADRYVAGGVASSWQDSPPHPIFIDRGEGNRIYDIDGNEYLDFHIGYGAMAVGHAHPKIAEVVSSTGTPRHPFRPADRGRRRVGRAPHRAVRPPALALRQLRHRSDDRRRAPDAGEHRPRHPAQDRGLLPRPSRSVMVQWRPTGPRSAPHEHPNTVPQAMGIPHGVRRPRPGGAVQRPARR